MTVCWWCRTEIVVIVVNDVSPDSVSRSAQVMNPGEQIITVLILSKPEQIYSGYQEINTVIKALQYEHHCFEGNCSKDQLNQKKSTHFFSKIIFYILNKLILLNITSKSVKVNYGIFYSEPD